MEGGTWLVLAMLGSALEKNLRNLNPLGGARGGAMAMAMAKTMRIRKVCTPNYPQNTYKGIL
jgi:hypothetical protein